MYDPNTGAFIGQPPAQAPAQAPASVAAPPGFPPPSAAPNPFAPPAAPPGFGAPAAPTVAPNPFGTAFAPPTAAAPPVTAAPNAGPPPPDVVDIDEQTAYQPTPVGNYRCRLAAALGDPAKSGKEMVTARWTIIEGPEQGREVSLWYVTTPQMNKQGKWNSRGIADIREDFARVGRPLPPRTMFPTKGLDAARIYAQGMNGIDVLIAVEEVERRDKNTGKVSLDRRARIVGPFAAGMTYTPASGGANPFG